MVNDINKSIIRTNQAKYDIKLTLFMFTILISSAIAGQNRIMILGYTFESGILIYPLTFLFVAAITELYDFEYARSIIWTSACCSWLMAVILFLFTLIPFQASQFLVSHAFSYHKFCRHLALLLSLGTFGYLVSEYTNAWVLSRLKSLTNNRIFLFRALFSLSIAVFLDTWIFLPFFLIKHIGLGPAILETSIDTVFKIIYELLLLPVLWIFVEYVKNREGGRLMLPRAAAPYSSVAFLKSRTERSMMNVETDLLR